jgi:hypothetical protein
LGGSCANTQLFPDYSCIRQETADARNENDGTRLIEARAETVKAPEVCRLRRFYKPESVTSRGKRLTRRMKRFHSGIHGFRAKSRIQVMAQSDQELCTFPVLDPFRRFATTSPSLSGRRITVLGRHFTQRSATAASATGEYIADREAVLLHLSANAGDDLRDFATTSVFDLLSQHLLLLQKFL